MKKKNKNHFKITIFSLLCVFVAFPVHADGADASRAGAGMIITMKKVIADTMELSVPNRICHRVKGGYLVSEINKVKYNHIFHELISDDQISEINKLKEEINSRDCENRSEIIEIYKFWIAYDEKWYAEIRAEKEAEKERFIEQWKSEIVPNKDDKWDGVINGVFLSIPRKYIWFGRLKPDSYQDGMNLQFFYPDMTAIPAEDADIKGPTNIGGVLSPEYTLTYPCFGFEGREECTAFSYQSEFAGRFLDCNSYKRRLRDGYIPYHGRWRRQCNFREGNDLDLESVFDEDVGMWRVGTSGYYEGVPEFPDYWINCEKPKDLQDALTHGNRQCRSAISLGENLYFGYSFPRHLFLKHREIHQRLKSKLEGFIIKISEERIPL